MKKSNKQEFNIIINDILINNKFKELNEELHHGVSRSDHPLKALENASKYYNITSLEANIIESHMFPVGKKIPKYTESWIVTVIDKMVALYEMYRFKLSLKLGVYLIFAFNMLTIQR